MNNRVMPSYRTLLRTLLAVLLLSITTAAVSRADGDPSALWDIVHGRCVPDQLVHDAPAPCAMVD
ncbi:MAG: CDP-diacylglycerol pyrophosphatase, partial [Mycobacterium sp.]|nr:CDP-diacylglycerol pyrophosphatase [Mycobacterium sp.]